MVKIFVFIFVLLKVGLAKAYDENENDNQDQLLGDEQCLNRTDLREMMSNILDEITDMKDCFLRREENITESACTVGVEDSVQRILDWVNSATEMEEQLGFNDQGESRL